MMGPVSLSLTLLCNQSGLIPHNVCKLPNKAHGFKQSCYYDVLKDAWLCSFSGNKMANVLQAERLYGARG